MKHGAILRSPKFWAIVYPTTRHQIYPGPSGWVGLLQTTSGSQYRTRWTRSKTVALHKLYELIGAWETSEIYWDGYHAIYFDDHHETVYGFGPR